MEQTLLSIHLFIHSINIGYVLVSRCKPVGFCGASQETCNAGDVGLIPGSGRYPGVGNDNLLQYSCLENSMDRGAWQATVLGVAKSWTRLRPHSIIDRR